MTITMRRLFMWQVTSSCILAPCWLRIHWRDSMYEKNNYGIQLILFSLIVKVIFCKRLWEKAEYS
jgi:hypothetical protein